MKLRHMIVGSALTLAALAGYARAQDNPFDTDQSDQQNPFDQNDAGDGGNPFDQPAASGDEGNPFDQSPAVQNTFAAQQLPAESIVMNITTLNDPGMGNMKSHRIMAPKGWSVTGGGWWPDMKFFKVYPSQDIKVTAPDGRMVHIGPAITATDLMPSPQLGMQRPAEGSVDSGLPVVYMPGSLSEWQSSLQNKILPQTLTGASNIRVSQVTVVPELTQILQKQLEPIRQMTEQQNQQNRSMGFNYVTRFDAAFLSASATFQRDGKNWEMLLMFGTSAMVSDSDIGRSFFWSVEPSVMFVAEQGQLDANMPLFLTISYSMQMTPEWSKMKYDHIAKMNQIAAKGAADRAQIWANSNREIAKMRNATYNQQQASQDRSNEKFIKAIREVEDYSVAGSSESVQLPSHYNYVYTNNVGDYILTNDSLYNPNTDLNINNRRWDTMQMQE